MSSPSARRRVWRALGNLLLPQSCFVCGEAGGSEPVCPSCTHELLRVRTACVLCALPLPRAGLCGRCQKKRPSFDATQVALLYAFPADRLVQALKYRHRLGLAGYFSGLLLASVLQPPVDCIVPVPMHPRALRERGFNQAVEIARPLARAWRLPLLLGGVRRVQDGPAQASLSGLARRRSLRRAFEVDATAVRGRSVLVVDDVMTTGTTLEHLARALKAAGATGVHNIVLARTP